MIVYDPTSYETHFFAIPSAREEGKKLQEVITFLNDFAAEFAKTIGADPPRKILQLEEFNEGVIDPLTFVEPAKGSSGTTIELDVRTLHDTVMLRATALHRGSFEPEQVKKLDFSTPLTRVREAVSYLGAFRVLYAETDEQEGAKRAQVAKALATAFDRTWLSGAEPIVTPIGTMLFGVQPRKLPLRPEVAALDMIFVGGRDAAEVAESYVPDPFLFTLPELALCHLKVRNAADNIRLDWLPEVARRESELRVLLPKRGEGNQPHQEMLERNDLITERQADLVDAVVHVQAELRTLRINRDNFAVTADGEPFKRVADKLKHLLIDRWVRIPELQAENALGYVEGTLRRAETHFKSIEAGAAAGQARELSTINRRVIILGVLSLLIAVLSLLAAAVQTYLAWNPPPAPMTPARQPQ